MKKTHPLLIKLLNTQGMFVHLLRSIMSQSSTTRHLIWHDIQNAWRNCFWKEKYKFSKIWKPTFPI